jgi:hypothetical protein
MDQLGVAKPARRLAVHDEADTYSRPDGDVGEIIEPPSRSPPHLRSRRTVDIGIECDTGAGRSA